MLAKKLVRKYKNYSFCLRAPVLDVAV